MPYAHTCTLFFRATGFGACYRAKYGNECGNPKRKTPNGFGGLDPWRWAILESVRNRKGKIPIPRPHKPTKNIGGYAPFVAFPTVATPLTMPILPEKRLWCQQKRKKAQNIGKPPIKKDKKRLVRPLTIHVKILLRSNIP
jgi:hypothetical protein